MSDNLRIDSHKLHLHPNRVAKWLNGDNIGPIFMEVSPSGACNHRCRFCGYDFMNYVPKFLDLEIYRQRIPGIAATGVKSIMFSGEGEPFMNRNFTEICTATLNAGIDVGITSNGALMTPEKLRPMLGRISWIKVSCNGMSPGSYDSVHRGPEGDFEKVMNNLEAAVAMRRELDSNCTLGLQSLLLPENAGEMKELALRCRKMGLDYMVVKPYSQHPQGITKEFDGLTYEEFKELGRELSEISTDSFNVIFRKKTMDRLQDQERGYDRCHALPFWSYMDVDMNIWGCGIYIGDDRFHYGNLTEQSFEELWAGEKRMQSLKWCNSKLDPSSCRVNCRMDKINAYLWELKNPSDHVNFI